MIYKITYGFQGGNQGWAETHAQQQADTNPQNLAGMHVDIAQKRANFLGAPFAVNAIRIARFFDEVLVQRARGSFLIKQTFTSQQPTVTGAAEPADVALISRGAPNLSDPVIGAAFAGSANQTFLGGPPDDAVSNGGDVNLGAAGLGAALAAWRSACIQANLGWLAVARADDVEITSAVQNPNGTVLITIAAPFIGGQPLNKKCAVRVRGVNNGQSPLNGQLLGTFKTNVTFQTSGVIGIPTPQIGGFMRVYKPNPQFLAYAGMQTELKTGQHDRGRPFGSPRGRQRRTVRG